MTHKVDLIKTEYNWTLYEGTYVCGYLFYDDYLYTGNVFAKFVNSLDDVLSVVKEAKGEFCIAKTDGKKLFACCDAIRSYPLFYTVIHDKLTITDTAETLIMLEKAKISRVFEKEYLASGFVSEKNTLYDGIYAIQAGEYLIADTAQATFHLKSYYLYDTAPLSNLAEEDLLDQLDHVLNNAFDRLVRTLGGRQVVVPLSGGFDSRLVVQMLHKKGVTNVVCFSYGGKNSDECVYSKQIADSLGYRWIYVDLSLTKWRDYFKHPQAEKFFYDRNNISAIPYIQHYVAVSILLDGDFEIEKNCIVITGNGGDFLEGKNIHTDIFRQQTYSRDDVRRLIASQHEILAGKKPLSDLDILAALNSSIPVGESFTADEAARIAERFNWRERQSKYVAADSRAFEALGVAWRLPLWDKELMSFWETIPPKLRAERQLYFKFIREEQIGNANVLTLYQKVVQFAKKRLPHLLNMIIIAKRIGEYYTHPFHWYGIVSFREYLKSVIRTGGASGFSICTIVAEKLYNYYTKDGNINE